jgi:NADH:ubiquinone oxidoreductase subunit F (NADH-binding)
MSAVAGNRRIGPLDVRSTVVVANGTEGEPASAKDKTLLSVSPHLVLDGAVLAAGAVGAREIVLCVDRAAGGVAGIAAAALAERQRARIDPVPIRMVATPTRYVAGEESALVHWLNGGEAKPTVVPPRPFQRGVGGRPTLVQNVETLANLALIARYGADWFRSLGTAADPGTTLVTISGAVSRPGVYEVALGQKVSTALVAAGADWEDVQAVLIGGYFGTWVPGAALTETRLSAESLGAVGASLGCGVLFALPAGACGLAEIAGVTRWLAGQNAGQCGPCLHGLPAIATAMAALVQGDPHGHAEMQARRWLHMVAGRGACKHPDGTARFVESGLGVFAAEVDRHRHRGPCPPQAPLLPAPASGGWR